MSKNIEAVIGYSRRNKPTAHKYTRLDDEEYEESELNYFTESDYEMAIEIMKDVASFGPEETIDLQKLVQMAKLKINLSDRHQLYLLDNLLGDIADWSLDALHGLILPVVIIDRNTGFLTDKVCEWVSGVCEDTPIEDYIANERKELHEMFKGTR